MGLINELGKNITEWAVRKGWRGEGSPYRSVGDDCALITTEVSEAMDAWRESGDPTFVWFTYTHIFDDGSKAQLSASQWLQASSDPNEPLPEFAKPEGFGPELADACIRIFETATHYGIDLEFEIDRKMAYNEKRPFRHGGKHL